MNTEEEWQFIRSRVTGARAHRADKKLNIFVETKIQTIGEGEMSQRLPEVKFHSYTVLDGSEQVLVQKVGDGSIIKRFDKTPIPQRLTDVVCPHFLELKWAYGCHARAENQPRKSTNLHLGNGSLGDTLL